MEEDKLLPIRSRVAWRLPKVVQAPQAARHCESQESASRAAAAYRKERERQVMKLLAPNTSWQNTTASHRIASHSRARSYMACRSLAGRSRRHGAAPLVFSRNPQSASLACTEVLEVKTSLLLLRACLRTKPSPASRSALQALLLG